MNVAIILAGGSGSRMNNIVPKQYLCLKGVPVIVHTLQIFQQNPHIDKIIIVVGADWLEYVNTLCERYQLDKVSYVVKGGQSSHESLYNGIQCANEHFDSDDIIIVHESVRPFITNKVIDKGIRICQEKGNAITAITGNEALLYSEDGVQTFGGYDRDKMYQAQMPQFFKLKSLVEAFDEAGKKHIVSQSLNTLMIELKRVPLFINEGLFQNIKLTKEDDLPFFEYLLEWRLKEEK